MQAYRRLSMTQPLEDAARVRTNTVRDRTYALLRAHGMTTIFGNPGSTEEPS